MIIILEKLNELSEAMSFLYSIAQNINYQDYYKKAKSSVFGEELYIKILEVAIQMQQTMRENLEVEKGRIDFYFKEIIKDYLCFNDFVLQYDFINYKDTLEDVVNRSLKLDDKERLLEFAKLITEYRTQGVTDDLSGIQDLTDLIRLLDKCDFSNANKIKILNAYCDKEKYILELKEILQKTIQILRNNKKEYQFLEEHFHSYWTNFTSKNDMKDIVERNSNIEWNYNPNGIVIQPLLAMPERLSISIPDEPDQEDLFRIGVLIDEKVRVRNGASNTEEISNIMKVLSDKSKLDILNRIRDHSAYGKELSDELKLAKGTISHHMSSLIGIGIIDTVYESNRIYYKLNQERVSQIFDEIKEFFHS